MYKLVINLNKIYKIAAKSLSEDYQTNSKLQRKDFKLNYLKQLLKVKHSPYEPFAKLKVNETESKCVGVFAVK